MTANSLVCIASMGFLCKFLGFCIRFIFTVVMLEGFRCGNSNLNLLLSV